MAEKIPYPYPSVKRDMNKTASTNKSGAWASVPTDCCRKKQITVAAARIVSVISIFRKVRFPMNILHIRSIPWRRVKFTLRCRRRLQVTGKKIPHLRGESFLYSSMF